MSDRLTTEKRRYPFFFSVVFHVVILILLMMNFDFQSSMPVLENSSKNTQVINAMVMDQPQKISEQTVISKPKPLPTPVTPKTPTPKVVTPTPQEKTDAIIIPDKKQKKLAQQKITQQLLDDLKKAATPQKKPRDLSKEFAKDMQALTQQKTVQQKMQQAERRIAGASTQQTQGVVDKYKALILQTISQNWIVPPMVDKHLYAELLIRVAPGGVVLDVQLIKSSGDASLDRSARAAVFKSSPLPVPLDPDAFDPFRQFVLKVRPENILAAENWLS